MTIPERFRVAAAVLRVREQANQEAFVELWEEIRKTVAEGAAPPPALVEYVADVAEQLAAGLPPERALGLRRGRGGPAKASSRVTVLHEYVEAEIAWKRAAQEADGYDSRGQSAGKKVHASLRTLERRRQRAKELPPAPTPKPPAR